MSRTPQTAPLRKAGLGLALALAASALPGAAAAATDPAGDIRAGFTAAQPAGDLDVISANATYDGASFVFSATLNGPVGTTAGALYVFGIDRGQGTARFGAIAPGVVFDAVVAVTAAGGATVRDFLTNPPPGPATPLPTPATISGNGLSVVVPASFLPSTGFLPGNYTVNLWPRVGAGSNDAQISDFAPDNANFAVAAATAVPEPASLLLLGAGLAGLAAARRRPRVT